MNRFFCLLCLPALLSISVRAQTFNSLGLEQGLSNDNVNVIYKDAFGFMWFGTFDGLNRYDGYTFTKFRNKIGDSTSLPDKEVYAIAENQERNLIIGTSKGVGIMDNKRLSFHRLEYDGGSLPGRLLPTLERVNDIKFDDQGNGYICTNNSGLLILPKNAVTAQKIALNVQNADYSVNAVTFGHDHSVWLSVEKVGLCKYDPRTKRIVLVAKLNVLVNSIVTDKNNNIWLGTNRGIYYYDQKTNSLSIGEIRDQSLQSSRIYRIKFDQDNKLWVATDGDGLIVVDVFGKEPVRIMKHDGAGTLTSNVIHDIFFDEEARKWFGTLGGGVNTIDIRRNQFTSLFHKPNMTNSLVESPVLSICEDSEKNIWIGTDGGGITVWNRKLNNYKQYTFSTSNKYSLINNRVWSIIKDDQSDIWIGTYGNGVERFDKDSGHFVRVPFEQVGSGLTYVVRLFQDRQKHIWATCLKGRLAGDQQKGLYEFNREKGAFVEAGLRVDKEIFSIDQDHHGNLLLGSLSNFFIADPKSGKTQVFHIGSIIRAIHCDKSGLVWLGTYDKGLMSYDPVTGKFRNYTENDGLCNNTILNIEEDEKQNIWVSTYHGISRLNPARNEFENFYAEDGLQSDQFTYNASTHFSTGEIAFGGIRGLSYFKPGSIQKYNSFPRLILTGVRINNDLVSATSEYIIRAGSIYSIDKIRLPYDKAILSVDFGALEYSQPGKIKYAYFLQGKDKSWNYVGNQHSINYSRLNEGSYILKIRSTNSSGVWNTDQKEISITVLPPWYRSWYAYVIYIVMFGGVVYGYIVYQKRKARMEYEVKLARLTALQEKELNEKKISFFTNISHELRTPLTLIVNPIKELLNNNGKNFDLIDISSVYRNTRRLLSMVDQLLLFRKTEEEISDLKPENLNLKDICQEVFLCFNNQVKAKQITYNFICKDDDLIVCADREKIEIVLFNVLSNAIKYTPSDGIVQMVLERKEGNIMVSVKDTGPGIPDAASEKLFEKFYRVPANRETSRPGFGIGLFLAKKLIDLHNGSIFFSKNDPIGTIFYVTVPAAAAKQVDHKDTTIAEIHEMSIPSELFPDISVDVTDHQRTSQRVSGDVLENLISNTPTILLIDDDVELRQYVKQLLISQYHVYEADNAETGFDIVSEIEPDIVVCDVVMDGMSGVEFCVKMKEAPALNHIPVILLTSSSSPDVKLKGIECGADDYITKPFESDLLLARIKGILKGRKTLKTYFLNEITLKNNSVKVPEEYRLFLSKCIEIIEKHLDDEGFNVKVFAREIGMSHSNLFKKIKSISGLSINEYIRFIRLRKAAELMIKTDLQIKEIVYKVGFQQVRYFREQFFKVFEVNPSDFIAKHRNTFSEQHKITDKFQQFNKS